MTPEQSQLWKKIRDFELDDCTAVIRFSKKLAQNNGWTLAYTHRVIAEYKKFLLMSCLTKKGVCPSYAVDQAWHLHLTFTRSYWVEFCQQTVNRQIHHHPTKGGNLEDAKLADLHKQTLNLYRDLFKTQPPADIWFTDGKANAKLQHIDTRKFWVVPKPGVSTVVLVALTVVPCLFIQAIPSAYTPFVMLGILGVVIIVLYRKFGDGEKEKNERYTSNCSNSGGDSSWNDSNEHIGHHSHSCHSDNGNDCGDACSSSGCCSGGGD